MNCPDISTSMVEKILSDLKGEGLIRKIGSGPSTAYVLMVRVPEKHVPHPCIDYVVLVHRQQDLLAADVVPGDLVDDVDPLQHSKVARYGIALDHHILDPVIQGPADAIRRDVVAGVRDDETDDAIQQMDEVASEALEDILKPQTGGGKQIV